MKSDGKVRGENMLSGKQGGRESLEKKPSGCITNGEKLREKGGKPGRVRVRSRTEEKKKEEVMLAKKWWS